MIGRFFLLSAIRSSAGFVYEQINSLRSQEFLHLKRSNLLGEFVCPVTMVCAVATHPSADWSGDARSRSALMVRVARNAGSLICARTRLIAVAFRRFRPGIYE